LTSPSDEVPVRDAATVALLRDTDAGIEVFMLKRSGTAVFSPSAHVFPGGALDDDDRDVAITAWCPPFDARHDLPHGYHVAAVREAFEEAGLLLACDATGDLVRLDDPEVSERFGLHRKAMHAGEISLAALCELEGLSIAVDRLVPFGHWITPPGAPRRFDTRFFATRAPAHQHASPDEIETTEGLWAHPNDVLAANAAGDVELILPTLRSLERLAPYATVDDALEALGRDL
jgi:8-oxo-dGTP pyrophosphatase MutT (NUDIX family)